MTDHREELEFDARMEQTLGNSKQGGIWLVRVTNEDASNQFFNFVICNVSKEDAIAEAKELTMVRVNDRNIVDNSFVYHIEYVDEVA
jgi:hypothetical protein